MNEKEKKELKQRIMTSVYVYKPKKRRINVSISIAASVLLILGISLFSYNNSQPDIVQFAETSALKGSGKTDQVQLVLDQNNTLTIQNPNSRITYESNGGGVNIIDSLGSAQKIAVGDANSFNTLIVPYGKRSEIVLSDGTIVWLNAGSKLIYPVSFNGGNREVFLTGEAIFEVVHKAQQPFKVLSGDQSVEVLGTVFNVSDYPGENNIRTILKSGSVEISHRSNTFFKSKENKKITPGTMAVFNKNTEKIKTEEVEVENYFSWREGYLNFSNNNLKHIMNKLNQYYNVSIGFENSEMENETFSGRLELKDSVDGALAILKEVAGFNYTINENGSILINEQ